VLVRQFAHFFSHNFFYIIGYGPHLRGAVCFANNKKVGRRLHYFPQVKRNNFAALLFLNSFNDSLENFGIAAKPYWSLGTN